MASAANGVAVANLASTGIVKDREDEETVRRNRRKALKVLNIEHAGEGGRSSCNLTDHANNGLTTDHLADLNLRDM